LIFSIWPRVAVKLGDERHVYDRATLMFREVQEIEKATSLSYAEWEQQLGRYSITAIAALLHVLRKRAGQPSDFATMEFAAADLEVVPLHDDDTEYTPDEAAAELTKRIADANGANGAGPTRAADAPEAPSGAAGSTPPRPTSPSSPPVTASGRGNGNGSRGKTGSSSKRTPTRT
jgi:hypothetical protein